MRRLTPTGEQQEVIELSHIPVLVTRGEPRLPTAWMSPPGVTANSMCSQNRTLIHPETDISAVSATQARMRALALEPFEMARLPIQGEPRLAERSLTAIRVKVTRHRRGVLGSFSPHPPADHGAGPVWAAPQWAAP